MFFPLFPAHGLNVFASFQSMEFYMPYHEGGDLFDRLTKSPCFSESDASSICRVVAEFLVEAHDRKMVHRDLKPENILLRSKSSNCNVCVADFGLATSFEPGAASHSVD